MSVNIKGRFVDLFNYPECTQFALVDATMEEGQTKEVKAKLTKVVKPGLPDTYQLEVYDK